MIHPDSVVRTVNPVIGNGVFATAPIPRGTLVVVRDAYDLCLTREAFQALPEVARAAMETYLYHDKQGDLVLGWDHARYMNHSCNSNTMMTDYEFEIAVRDIAPGEEITTEYGLLNIQEPYPLACGCTHCRRRLRLDDLDRHAECWDRQIRESLRLIDRCPQPLWALVSERTRADLAAFAADPARYRSVRNLKWRL